MSDSSSTPPKPKPGSLRDRIAAFEKPASAAPVSGTAPAPRPKPGGISWKPKVPSPPSSPSGVDHALEKKVGGGMSASDAKESIGKGGSLKERMAALQNRGGFGAPPPVAPKPSLEKPKWKPPPVIAPVSKDENDEPSQAEPVRSAEEQSTNEASEVSAPAAEGDDQAEADPEDEERQRRAAIAARMARLGGARVGMAPVFGKKPVGKKSDPVEESVDTQVTQNEDKLPKDISSESSLDVAPPLVDKVSGEKSSEVSLPKPPTRKSSESASLLSSDSEYRSPNSMPMPSAPRRAAPPRKKAVKSPEQPPPPVLEETLVTSPDTVPTLDPLAVSDVSTQVESSQKENVGDVEKEIYQVDKKQLELSPTVENMTPSVIAADPSPVADDSPIGQHIREIEQTADFAPHHAHDVPEGLERDDDIGVYDSAAETETEVATEPVLQTTDEPEMDEEAEEAARRQRVAEKLAKMGGVNPFAPQRKPSAASDDVQVSPTMSPTLAKRASITQESVRLPRRQSTRMSSVDSPTVSEELPSHSSLGQATQPSPLPEEYSTRPSISGTNTNLSERNTQDDSSHVGQRTGTTFIVPEPAEGPSDVELPANDEGESKPSKTDDDENIVSEATKEKTYSDPVLSDELSKDLDDSVSEVPPALVIPTTPNTSVQAAPADPALPMNPVPLPPLSVHQVPNTIASPVSVSQPSPPRLILQPNDVEEEASDSEDEYTPPHDIHPPLSPQQIIGDEGDQPPRHLPPRFVSSSETVDEDSPLPVPNRRLSQTQDGGMAAVHTSSSRPFRPVPPPPPLSAPTSDGERDSDYDEVLPTPPRRRPMTPGTPPTNEVPLIVPPPTSDDFARKVEPSPLRQSYPPLHQISAVTPTTSGEQSPSHLSPLSGSEQEILDEEEGDPIDPSFHSPSRRTSTINSSAAGLLPSQERDITSEEDEQQARRQTIAERMARLGGIKFGAAPLPTSTRPPQPTTRMEEEEAVVPVTNNTDEISVEQSDEEEERARKERIAAKLASMGGMRIGMLPSSTSAPRTHPSSVPTDQMPATSRSQVAPPSRPPPPPQPQDSDADPESSLSASQQSLSTSDDGIKVEAEESEIEEVSHEDAREIEETPPPIPSRGPRRRGTGSESEAPPNQATRPPVPTSLPTRKPSVPTTSAGRKSSTDSSHSIRRPSIPKPQSEYVMVEEPSGFTDDIPPPPPARPSSRPPPRTVPPPPPSTQEPLDSISSQWELPSIPTSSLDFGGGTDLSLSWTEESHPISMSPPAPPPPEKQSARPQSSQTLASEQQLSADSLMAIWGRVGVQICEVATTLFEKSKRSLVGDGSFDGFVNAVLSEVPNAELPTQSSYGYLIYVQFGNSVQRRSSEIMPGDVVVLQDAKLKGHKGIHAYNQIVGVGEKLVGIISEFEPKKSKIRVFQANQHVGQQTVEAVSYRLEDLKAGTVKVYRVLEN